MRRVVQDGGLEARKDPKGEPAGGHVDVEGVPLGLVPRGDSPVVLLEEEVLVVIHISFHQLWF